MAKRRRLTPARPDIFTSETAPARPPIAQVAGDVAVSAALEEVQSELQAAQREGRMVLKLPLEKIRADHLIRDRQQSDDEDMAALKESLKARGQQTPIEVVTLEDGAYGLISGWRRLLALKELLVETGEDRFATAHAILRQPEDQSAAYVAMVEENEIRAPLSFYERARIALMAVRAGVYDSDKQALQTLFSAVSFSKRSKIKSFMPLVAALDDVLRFPTRIPERLGLSLSKALSASPDFSEELVARLRKHPAATAEAERSLMESVLKTHLSEQQEKVSNPGARDTYQASELRADLKIRHRKGRVELQGAAITEEFIARLTAWLEAQR